MHTVRDLICAWDTRITDGCLAWTGAETLLKHTASHFYRLSEEVCRDRNNVYVTLCLFIAGKKTQRKTKRIKCDMSTQKSLWMWRAAVRRPLSVQHPHRSTRDRKMRGWEVQSNKRNEMQLSPITLLQTLPQRKRKLYGKTGMAHVSFPDSASRCYHGMGIPVLDQGSLLGISIV